MPQFYDSIRKGICFFKLLVSYFGLRKKSPRLICINIKTFQIKIQSYSGPTVTTEILSEHLTFCVSQTESPQSECPAVSGNQNHKLILLLAFCYFSFSCGIGEPPK